MRKCKTLRRSVAAITATVLLVLVTSDSRGYTPESPEVKQMVDRAVAFMIKSGEDGYHQHGAAALVALALYKAGVDKSHKMIQEGVQASQAMARQGAERANETYSPAICCILLCEIDQDRYRQDIERLVQGLVRRQRPDGSWTYNPPSYDDTSQTQYGVLSLWTAHQHGVQVPFDAIERATQWLIRYQDRSGGWSYIPVPDQKGTLSVHKEITHSMSSAGAGSLYMCAHLLGYRANNRAVQSANGLPLALRRVDSEKQRAASEFLKANRATVAAALERADGWFSNNLRFDTNWWTFYYMYGLERYKSFQEIVNGQVVQEPGWYNQGVTFLRSVQKKDGSWYGSMNPQATPPVQTAFAVLFLTRSTKKAIQAAEQGILISGKSLPKDLTKIQLRQGQVVDEKETPTIEELLALLEDADSLDDEDLQDLPHQLELSDDPAERAQQLARLKRLAISGSYEARLTAVKTLGRDRNLDHVPILIFALSDPDWRIQKAARDGLRFISRNFDGFGMPEKPKRHEWQEAQKKWAEWYLSIRPDGNLIQ